MQSSLHHTLRERSGEMNPHPRFVGCARRESVLGFLSEVSETQQGCEREKQAPAHETTGVYAMEGDADTPSITPGG